MTGFTEDDRRFMERAISLAEKGRGHTTPNPMVGAVIVKDGNLVSEGYHSKAGKDHAEIEAIKNSPASVRGSTMYVSLEPCTISGRTPPCTDELIKQGFTRVVVGAVDPNPKVSGSGIKKLESAGIDVASGLYRERVRRQNEVFFKNMTAGMPFVCAKIASSIDGKLAASSSDSKWITCADSRKKVQDLRREYSCVLTGINTVLVDDPSLFPKQDLYGTLEDNMSAFLAGDGSSSFTRVILDAGLRIPPDSAIMKTADRIRTIIFTGPAGQRQKAGKKHLIIETGSSMKWDPADILNVLYQKYGITSVMLEAGPFTLTSFLKIGQIDKYIFFLAPMIIGGENMYNMFGETGTRMIKDSKGLRFDSFRVSGDDIMITAYPAEGGV